MCIYACKMCACMCMYVPTCVPLCLSPFHPFYTRSCLHGDVTSTRPPAFPACRRSAIDNSSAVIDRQTTRQYITRKLREKLELREATLRFFLSFEEFVRSYKYREIRCTEGTVSLRYLKI